MLATLKTVWEVENTYGVPGPSRFATRADAVAFANTVRRSENFATEQRNADLAYQIALEEVERLNDDSPEALDRLFSGERDPRLDESIGGYRPSRLIDGGFGASLELVPWEARRPKVREPEAWAVEVPTLWGRFRVGLAARIRRLSYRIDPDWADDYYDRWS